MRKPVIGLTGGMGCGKSLVAGQLMRLNCAVIDADRLAKEALDQPEVRDGIANRWGPGIIGPEGRVDRRALAQLVFAAPQQLRRLEALTHPYVKRGRGALHDQYQADLDSLAIVEDCPLLMEVGLDKECDSVIFIHTSRRIRLTRVAAARGWSEQDLALREKNQWPLDKKAQRADYVLVNNASESACFAHVRSVFSQILKRSAS